MKASLREILKFGSLVAFKNSFLLAGLYTLYFIIARISGFATIMEFRYFNYVIAFVVCFYTVKTVYVFNNNYIEYFTGMAIGILNVALAQFWYSLVFFLYLNVDHSFLNYLLHEMPQNDVAPTASLGVLLLAEGLGFSPIIALTMMQYFKWTSARWAHATT